MLLPSFYKLVGAIVQSDYIKIHIFYPNRVVGDLNICVDIYIILNGIYIYIYVCMCVCIYIYIHMVCVHKFPRGFKATASCTN